MTGPASTVQSALTPPRAGQAQQQTQTAIANAAERTGVDFGYLLAQARIESGMNPRAEARTSSASGLYQFIDQTWLATMDKHGEQLGYAGIAGAIETSGGRARVTDPAMRDEIMALRFDPQAASLMAGALATDNRAALTPMLGRDPDASELYLAHFLGSDGASRFLSTLTTNPDASAANLLPRAAGANRAIFYEPSGSARSVADVMALVRGRVESAMNAGGAGPVPMPAIASSPALPGFTPPAQTPAAPSATDYAQYAPARRSTPVGQLQAQAQPLPSMASTLRDSFGLGSGANSDAAPGIAHVRNAYARLEAFGL